MSQNKTQPVAAPVVDEAIVATYKAADKGAKARLRKSVTDQMMVAVDNLDGIGARNLRATLAAMVSTPEAAPKADPAQVLADRIATLRLALTMLEQGTVRPEGLDVAADVTLPTGTADQAAALKVASAKVTRSGERRPIAAAIERAFADVPEGTVLTVRQIAKGGAIEGYVPSDGAVSNALKTGDLDFIEVLDADADGPLRARKA